MSHSDGSPDAKRKLSSLGANGIKTKYVKLWQMRTQPSWGRQASSLPFPTSPTVSSESSSQPALPALLWTRQLQCRHKSLWQSFEIIGTWYKSNTWNITRRSRIHWEILFIRRGTLTHREQWKRIAVTCQELRGGKREKCVCRGGGVSGEKRILKWVWVVKHKERRFPLFSVHGRLKETYRNKREKGSAGEAGAAAPVE